MKTLDRSTETLVGKSHKLDVKRFCPILKKQGKIEMLKNIVQVVIYLCGKSLHLDATMKRMVALITVNYSTFLPK